MNLALCRRRCHIARKHVLPHVVHRLPLALLQTHHTPHMRISEGIAFGMRESVLGLVEQPWRRERRYRWRARAPWHAGAAAIRTATPGTHQHVKHLKHLNRIICRRRVALRHCSCLLRCLQTVSSACSASTAARHVIRHDEIAFLCEHAEAHGLTLRREAEALTQLRFACLAKMQLTQRVRKP